MKKILILIILIVTTSFAQNAKEIVQKADRHMRANSSYSEMKMTIIKPEWKRTMGMKIWALEPDYSLIFITEPARDKGTVTLKGKMKFGTGFLLRKKSLRFRLQ